MAADSPDASPPPDEPTPAKPPRAVSRDEFRAALDAHAQWLRTDGREGARLDLTGRRLPPDEALAKADLRRAVLARVEWRRADLIGADLRGAELSGAALHELNLSGARLDSPDTRLEGAALHAVRLAGADLSGARLDGVRVAHGDWTGARLDKARLDGASVEHAKLAGVLLHSASLRGAQLRQIDLTGSRLLKADLTGADLWRARLGGADLREVTGLVPDETYVAGARFSPAPGLRVPRLRFLRATRAAPWPPGRDPWSLLRQTYAGPRAVFLLLGLACFAVPYMAKLVALVQISHAERLAIPMSKAGAAASRQAPDKGGWLSKIERAQPSEGGWLPKAGPAQAYEASVEKQMKDRFGEPVPVWWVLLGLHKGHGWEVARLAALAAYNLCLFWLVRRVGPMRDEEQRSGYSPPWAGYRRLVRLHGVCSALLYVSLASFVWNVRELLIEEVYPLKEAPAATAGGSNPGQ
jgi:uncharacterized protein YjbI with pentapeptide repeats